MLKKIASRVEEIRIELDSMIKKVDYNSGVWQYLVDAKGALGQAKIELNEEIAKNARDNSCGDCGEKIRFAGFCRDCEVKRGLAPEFGDAEGWMGEVDFDENHYGQG